LEAKALYAVEIATASAALDTAKAKYEDAVSEAKSKLAKTYVNAIKEVTNEGNLDVANRLYAEKKALETGILEKAPAPSQGPSIDILRIPGAKIGERYTFDAKITNIARGGAVTVSPNFQLAWRDPAAALGAIGWNSRSKADLHCAKAVVINGRLEEIRGEILVFRDATVALK
jgi:hypothetical protein